MITTLTDEFRPKIWDEVAGQEYNKKLLKNIADNPNRKPQVIILEGPTGTGKTTCARIFAREVNKASQSDFDFKKAPFYHEYDYLTIRQIPAKELSDNVFQIIKDYWVVFTLDEFHTYPDTTQSSFLKLFEDISGNRIFYILCTTEIGKINKAIRSRALELKFELVSQEEVRHSISRVADSKNIILDNEVFEIIVSKSGGHMRSAVMLLDQYLILKSKDEFIKYNRSSHEILCSYFNSVIVNNEKDAIHYLTHLSQRPLSIIKSDIEDFIWQCLKHYAGIEIRNNHIKILVDTLGPNLRIILDYYFSDLFNYIYRSDQDFKNGLLYLFKSLAPQLPPSKIK